MTRGGCVVREGGSTSDFADYAETPVAWMEMRMFTLGNAVRNGIADGLHRYFGYPRDVSRAQALACGWSEQMADDGAPACRGPS